MQSKAKDQFVFTYASQEIPQDPDSQRMRYQ